MVWSMVLILLSCSLHAQEVLAPIEVAEQIESMNEFIPLLNSTISEEERRTGLIHRLSDISNTEAAVTTSYSSQGYWDMISVRGVPLSNRSSYLRDGLPISAESVIALENKEQLVVLKGVTSGLTALTPPGGAVNYVTKRPKPDDHARIFMEYSQDNNWLVSTDINRHHGKQGLRINLVHEEIDPLVENIQGQRHLLAMAHDYVLSDSLFVRSEIEWVKQSSPSAPGFSLLGNRLPPPIDPNRNLNHQTWTRSVEFSGLTGSLGLSKELSDKSHVELVYLGQFLETSDYLAYPYGCSAENNYDRYCADGSFDLYDYRSPAEYRQTQTVQFELISEFKLGGPQHEMTVGSWLSDYRERQGKQGYNFVGTGQVSHDIPRPADPRLLDEGVRRSSQSLDFYLGDNLSLGKYLAWLGVRHTNLTRASERSDGSQKTNYTQRAWLPWLGVGYQFDSFIARLNYSEGVESFVTPNRPEYEHAGSYLANVRGQQWELALNDIQDNWKLAVFKLKRPVIYDAAPLYKVDGHNDIWGFEGQWQQRFTDWNIGFSYMAIRQHREDAKQEANLNGKRQINVPDQVLRQFTEYHIPRSGFIARAAFSYEASRAVTADNSIMLPAWNKWDLSIRYRQKKWSGQLALENAFANRYWRESPTQYGHIYLFAGAARRLSLSGTYQF